MATAAVPDNLTQAKPARSHLPFILGLALLARVALAFAYYHANPQYPLTRLADEDISIAMAIHTGHGFASPFLFPSGPTAFLTPGYPYLIAGFIGLFGTGSLTAYLIVAFQLLLSLVTVAVVAITARQHFGMRVSNFAALICATAVPILLAPMYIWDTSISAFILVVGILLAPFVRSKTHFAAAGAGCAAATLINPSLLPTLVAVFAWSAWRAKIFPWLGIAVFTIVFSPWPIRNFVQLHAFVPLRSNAGYEVWLGNHPGSDGDSPKFVGPAYESEARERFLAEGEVAYMREKSALAHEWIVANPLEFARLSAKRFVRFWSGSSKSPTSMTIPLAIASMIGLALLWRSRDTFILFAIPLVIFPLPYYITHADARYQFAIDPVLAILAGYACEWFLTFIERKPQPRQRPISH